MKKLRAHIKKNTFYLINILVLISVYIMMPYAKSTPPHVCIYEIFIF